MPEYLSPGVYVEEIDAGPKPIEGVSTSTAGAVGVTAFGPTDGKPVLVTSFAEFVRKFGGFLPEPSATLRQTWDDAKSEGGRWWQFPLSVKAFFDNGGQRIYIKRVFSSGPSGAAASSGKLGKGLVSDVIQDAPKGATRIKLAHLIGIQNTILAQGGNPAQHQVKFFDGKTNQPIGTDFTIKSYDSQSGYITVDPLLPNDLQAKRGDFAEIKTRSPSPIAADQITLLFAAKSYGAWGDKVSVRVTPTVAASLNLIANAALADNASFSTTVESVTFVTTITVNNVTGLNGGEVVVVDGREYTAQTVDTANNRFSLQVRPPVWPAGTPIKKKIDPAFNATYVSRTVDGTIKMAAVDGLKNNFWILVNGKEYKVTNLAAAPANTLKVEPNIPDVEDWVPGTTVRRLRNANAANSSAQLNIWGASALYVGSVVELDNGNQKEFRKVNAVDGDTVTFDGGNLSLRYFEGHKARIVEASVLVSFEPEGQNPVEEAFSPVRLQKDGSTSSIANYVNSRSALVTITHGPVAFDADLSKFPCAANGGWQDLENGTDALHKLAPEDFIGADNGPGKRTGIASLEDIDEISICMAPGIWAPSVLSALMIHCETLKDRFAIVDPPDGLDIEGIRSFREPIDTKYAALYYPWLKLRDPLSRQEVRVAPSGHMAGIYARVDVERGVHKAPANEVVRGITGFAEDVTKREQDMLNPKNINAFRFFPGRGNRVWGARVLTSDSAWKYINVRRLFIFVEESIDEGTQWVVFEPNDEQLWVRVRQSVSNFLETVWRSGALMGTKADEAFFVRCDRSTMSQDDLDNGRLICLIGIAPVKPAEFVIFRIQQKTLNATNS